MMDPGDPNIALAGTWFSGIFRTSNGGQYWSLTVFSPASALILVGTIVFAGTSYGILSSQDFGMTWTSVAPTTTPVRALAFSKDGRTLYAGLHDGTIMSSTDGGASWNTKFRFSSATIWSLAINSTSPTTVYTVAWVNSYTVQTLWSSTDGGGAWSQVPSAPVDIQYVATDPNKPGVIFAMGGYASSSKSTDGGKSFTNLNLNADVRGAIVTPQNGNVVLVASDQGIYETKDGGLTWTSLNGNLANSLLTAGSVSGDGRTFISAVQDYSPIVSFDGGSSWTISSTAYGEDGGALINPANSRYAYVFTISGLFTSTDGGNTFTLNSAIPPPGLGNVCPNQIAVDPSSPSNLLAATSGGLYKSPDYGQSFQLISLPSQTVTAVAGLGSTIYASTTNDFLYSIDGGATWASSGRGLASTPRIAIDPVNSSVVVIGTDAGLYRSTSGGRLFSLVQGIGVQTEVTPPCGGAPAVYFAKVGGQVALFAGTGNGFFESLDLGATWENLSFNMNATHEVTSVEYAGGNLYVSTYGQGFLEWPHFPGVPLQPRFPYASPTPTKVTLSWSAPSFDGGTQVIGYKVYRGDSSTGERLLASIGSQTSYTDSSVVSGTTYYYNVTASNAVGESEPVSLSVVVPLLTLTTTTTVTQTTTQTLTSTTTATSVSTVTITSTSTSTATSILVQTSTVTSNLTSTTTTAVYIPMPYSPSWVWLVIPAAAVVSGLVVYALGKRGRSGRQP
ncbi:MAG: hypothetical protein LYZ70_07050 [Nitrososphaerales archaeon]|nr:hypothetical protein [Nitrososphaerales archaeon]